MHMQMGAQNLSIHLHAGCATVRLCSFCPCSSSRTLLEAIWLEHGIHPKTMHKAKPGHTRATHFFFGPHNDPAVVSPV
jgi:hypothetical protein